MIQLRKEVNKSEIMRELKNQAVKIYENSYQPDLQALAFIQGAEMIFDLLRLPVVGSSKPENKTITFEVEKLSELNPHRSDALIIVDKDGNYYQTVEDKTLS